MLELPPNIEQFTTDVEEDEVPAASDKARTLPQLRPSVFPNVPPFINFLALGEQYSTPWLPLAIPWHLWAPCTNPLLLAAMTRAGFTRTPVREASYQHCVGAIWDSIDSRTRFVMLCKLTKDPVLATKLLSESGAGLDLLEINPEAKINRLPGTLRLCRKSGLAELHSSFLRRFPELPPFVPETWSLPSQQEAARARLGAADTQLWIVKPCGQSGGRGVHLVTCSQELPCSEGVAGVDTAVLQTYISRPLTLRGHKFDLRLYVLVTSVCPLVAYLHQDGLARLATEQYSSHPDTAGQHCVHLTNSAVNKNNTRDYGGLPRGGDPYSGHLWRLATLRRFLAQERGLDWDRVWAGLVDTVRKTLLMAYPDLARDCRGLGSAYSCYKLLGLDLLLDEDTRPWLLEVNTDPCLAPDPVDADLKSEMIAEMFNIVGFHIPGEVAERQGAELGRVYPDWSQFSQQPRLYSRAGQGAGQLRPDQGAGLRLVIKLEEEAAQCRGFTRVLPAPCPAYRRYYPPDCGAGAEQLLGAWLDSRDLGLVREAAGQNKHLL